MAVPSDVRRYESPDGVGWGVEVRLPGSSNAMVVFHHPSGRTARFDRYAWYLANTPEARNVTSHLDQDAILEGFTAEQLARLFRRSMPISAGDTPLVSR